MAIQYALERKEPCPFKVRNELLKNMTNLPERWKAIRFSSNLSDLEGFVDENHRVVNWDTLEVIYQARGLYDSS